MEQTIIQPERTRSAVSLAFFVVSIAILATAALFTISSRFTLPGNYRLYSVLSGSMEPAVPTGALLITKVPADSSRIDTGDIITFEEPGFENKLITHRVVEKQAREDSFIFETQGDANDQPDSWQVPFGRIKGVYIMHIPLIGRLLEFIKSPLGIALFIILPVIVIAIDELKNIVLVLADRKTRQPPGDQPRRSRLRAKLRESAAKVTGPVSAAVASTPAPEPTPPQAVSLPSAQPPPEEASSAQPIVPVSPTSAPALSHTDAVLSSSPPAYPTMHDPLAPAEEKVDSIQDKPHPLPYRQITHVSVKPLSALLLAAVLAIPATYAAFTSNQVTIAGNSLTAAASFSPTPSPTPTSSPSPSPTASPAPSTTPTPSPSPSPAPDGDDPCDLTVTENLSNTNTGPNSTNENTVDINHTCTHEETNTTSVENDITAVGNTGGNEQTNNTSGGAITTGDVTFDLSISNTAP